MNDSQRAAWDRHRDRFLIDVPAAEMDTSIADDAHVETALSTRRGILDYCNKTKPDLIVIGRHVRTGLASLLGATADDILPGVNCDVLVVKLGEPV